MWISALNLRKSFKHEWAKSLLRMHADFTHFKHTQTPSHAYTQVKSLPSELDVSVYLILICNPTPLMHIHILMVYTLLLFLGIKTIELSCVK